MKKLGYNELNKTYFSSFLFTNMSICVDKFWEFFWIIWQFTICWWPHQNDQRTKEPISSLILNLISIFAKVAYLNKFLMIYFFIFFDNFLIFQFLVIFVLWSFWWGHLPGIEITWDYNHMVVHPFSGQRLGQASHVIKTSV